MIFFFHALFVTFSLLAHAQSNVTAKTDTDELPFEHDYDTEDVSNLEARAKMPVATQPRAPLRAPQDCGTYTMDCRNGPQACNNACFWQFCLQKDENHVYTDNGPEPTAVDPGVKYTGTPKADKNRVLSGVTGSQGNPCRLHPLVQKLYDPFLTSENWNDKMGPDLEADEWPQASMKQGPFVEGAAVPRNSLRCIPASDNGGMGNKYSNWRHEIGLWNPTTGLYRDERTCPGELVEGDRFKINFNLEGIENPEKSVPYCVKPPENAQRNCKNDGFQFYMSKFRPSKTYDESSDRYGTSAGRLGFPYDQALMNTYRQPDGDGDINEYFVQVIRSSKDQSLDQSEFKVEVFRRYSDPGNWRNDYRRLESIATGSQRLTENGDSMTIESNQFMRQSLVISRKAGCRVTFLYGDLKNKPLESFSWNTGTKGYNTDFSAKFPENKRPTKSPFVPYKDEKKKTQWRRNLYFDRPGVYCDIAGDAAGMEDRAWNPQYGSQAPPEGAAWTRIGCWFPGV